MAAILACNKVKNFNINCVEADNLYINNIALVVNCEFTFRIKLMLKDDMSHTVGEF